MSITYRQLEVFLAVTQSESISDAAASMGMSKSAVSQALAELESRLGVKLFERSRSRLLLSAEGLRLQPFANELVERTHDLQGFFRERSEGQLRVVCTLTVGTFILADLLRDFQTRTGWLPQVSVRNTAEAADLLLKFKADVAMIEGPVYSPELICEPWLEDEMVVVAGKGHPLVKTGADWDQLSREQWILREEGSSTRIFFDTRLALHLKHPRVALSVNSFESILGMVTNGMGITFMSSRVLHDAFYGEHLARIECPGHFKRPLSLCMHRGKYQSKDLLEWVEVTKAWAQMRAGLRR